MQEEAMQDASEPKEESEPSQQAGAEPGEQLNHNAWTQIAPAKQESKPPLHFDPIPKEASALDSLPLPGFGEEAF